MASLVNSILIPMIANRFIKNNIYAKNGLADDIFMLGLTNAFVPPVLKFIDGGYYFSKIMRSMKRKPCNFLIRLSFQTLFQSNLAQCLPDQYGVLNRIRIRICRSIIPFCVLLCLLAANRVRFCCVRISAHVLGSKMGFVQQNAKTHPRQWPYQHSFGSVGLLRASHLQFGKFDLGQLFPRRHTKVCNFTQLNCACNFSHHVASSTFIDVFMLSVSKVRKITEVRRDQNFHPNWIWKNEPFHSCWGSWRLSKVCWKLHERYEGQIERRTTKNGWMLYEATTKSSQAKHAGPVYVCATRNELFRASAVSVHDGSANDADESHDAHDGTTVNDDESHDAHDESNDAKTIPTNATLQSFWFKHDELRIQSSTNIVYATTSTIRTSTKASHSADSSFHSSKP